MTCPFCGKEHPDDTLFCPMTGKKIEQRLCHNPACDYREPLPPYAKFCPSCGWNLDDSTHTPAAPVSKVPRRKPLPADFKPDKSATHIDMSIYDTSEVTDMSFMFEDCSSLESLNLTSFDTSKVTDMSFMFEDCSSLESLDLRTFDTSRVTIMSFMFAGCTSLNTLNLSGFNCTSLDTHYLLSNSRVLSIYDPREGMFSWCYSLRKVIMRRCNQATVDMIRLALNEAGLTHVQIIV